MHCGSRRWPRARVGSAATHRRHEEENIHFCARPACTQVERVAGECAAEDGRRGERHGHVRRKAAEAHENLQEGGSGGRGMLGCRGRGGRGVGHITGTIIGPPPTPTGTAIATVRNARASTVLPTAQARSRVRDLFARMRRMGARPVGVVNGKQRFVPALHRGTDCRM